MGRVWRPCVDVVLRKTTPGWSHSNRKRWYCLIPSNRRKERVPASRGDDGGAILRANQLAHVAGCRVVDDVGEVVQRTHCCLAKLALHETKAGVRGELGMAWVHQVQLDGGISPCHDSPEQVLHHRVVLVLPTTLVSMQASTGLAQTVVAEEVQHADNLCLHPCLYRLPRR